MKKFTNISGAKVGQEPTPVKQSNEELELFEFKNQVMRLMDDLLAIRSYGVARPEIMIPTKIVGKEMFVEALTDLLTKKSNKDQIKALESLKSTNTDWVSIENKIDSIKDVESDIKEEKKILDIIEKWGSDESNLRNFLDGHIKRITKEEALEKLKTVEEIKKNSNDPLLNVIYEKYLEAYRGPGQSQPGDKFKRHLLKPEYPELPFKRDLTSEERRKLFTNFPFHSFSQVDNKGRIILGGGWSDKGWYYIKEEDLDKLKPANITPGM